MVEMLGGGEVPSGYYLLLKLASQLSSLYSTDIREALVIQSEETQNSKTVCLRISRRPYQLLCSKPKRVDSEMGDSRERRYCFHKCRLCKKLSCPLVARVKLRVSNCFLQAFLFVVVALQWLGRVPSGVSTLV